MANRRLTLIAVAITGAALGIGMLVLQRYVAETRTAAIALVVAWFAIVLAGLLLTVRRRPELRWPALATFVAILLGTVAIGYWTGFRDNEVNEEVAVAATEASGEKRATALAGGAAEPADAPEKTEKSKRPPGPVSLATGEFAGADGHSGTGTATVIEEADGDRLLTFTGFDVSPGANVDVYLSASPTDVSDRIELGDLKGNVGDQQYEIPASADLGAYPNVVLYCIPFSVRIAVAETDA